MATELTLQPSDKDTSLWEGDPDTNSGDEEQLTLVDIAAYSARSILEFDLSSIPEGAIIQAATLSLYYYDWDSDLWDPVGKTVFAYKLTRTDWEELEATWSVYKEGLSWANAGGDYVTPDGASITMPANYGWLSFNVLSLVQAAFGISNLVEFLIKFETEVLFEDVSWVELYSNNYLDVTTLRPKLVIEYEPAVAYYHGLKVQGVGELALCDVGTHPLRIRKGGVTYGIELVATDDPNASAVRIKTPSVGIKAIRKYT